MSEETRIKTFVGLSAVLTGIPKEVLAPAIDPIGIDQCYLDVIDHKNKSTLDDLLTLYQELKADGKTDKEIGGAILKSLKSAEAELARNIMKMWYLGVWYQEEPVGAVVSAQAYQVSAVWKVMRAHPMGYSTGIFGYWHEEPPARNKFLGDGP